MDILLISVTIGLIIMCGVLAWLAEFWRRRAVESEHAAMGMALDLSHASDASWDYGWACGHRHAIGLMYKIAVKAADEGRDVVLALRTREEEPVVQVLDRV